MAVNNTTGTEEEEEAGETFHVYILSFSYGLLLLIIFGHLVVRWRWRKFKVRKPANHFPGDKSFKSKAMRQKLCTDFESITMATPHPQLIDENYEPKMFGPCNDGALVPSHWYRMKTCEAVTAFVEANEKLLQGPLKSASSTATTSSQGWHPSQRFSKIQSLPDFLLKLRTARVLRVEGQEGEEVVRRSCDLYKLARYEDGVFCEVEFQEFSDCMRKLQDRIQGRGGSDVALNMSRSPGLTSSLTSGLEPESLAMKRLSMEPLLAARESSPARVPAETTVVKRPTTPRSKRPPQPELSPLIVESPRSSLAPLTQSFSIPETPV